MKSLYFGDNKYFTIDKIKIPHTGDKEFLDDADSRTDTILETLHCVALRVGESTNERPGFDQVI